MIYSTLTGGVEGYKDKTDMRLCTQRAYSPWQKTDDIICTADDQLLHTGIAVPVVKMLKYSISSGKWLLL